MKHSISIPLWITGILMSTIQGPTVASTNIVSLIRQSDTNQSIVNTNLTNGEETLGYEDTSDYIVKIQFVLNEATIIPYLRDLTYFHPDMFNITTEDLIELSNVREFTLDQSLTFLEKLNVSEDVINVKTFRSILEFSNLTFNEFFERLKNTTNLSGQPLQEALQILGIDPANFSTAVTFGNQNAVYDVLNQAVYTLKNLEEAAKVVGTDASTFYKNVKTIVLDQMKTLSLSYYDEKVREMPTFDKKAYDNVWMVLNLNTSDIFRVVNFRRIVDNIFNRLNENVTLGVVTGNHEIITHKKMYMMLQNMRDIVVIYAESILHPGKIYDNLTITKATTDNFATLWSNASLPTKVKIGQTGVNGDVGNCSYISINNSQVIENQVKVVNISENFIEVQTRNESEFNLGNPLICDGKLLGLASLSDKEKNLFSFDAFYQKAEQVPTTALNDARRNFNVLAHVVPLLLLVLIC